MDYSMPGFPVLHYLPEFAQIHLRRVGDAIQPSHPVVPFSSCLQSFPASGSFPMSWLFTSGDQSIGASSSAENEFKKLYAPQCSCSTVYDGQDVEVS